MTKNNPTHPGESIRLDCLEPLGLSVTEAAEVLGVSRNTMSEIVNGRAGISAEMAVRLEMTGWGTADAWLGLQRAYDLAHVNRDRLTVRRFSHPEPA